jgi:hypothetical protein
MQRLIDKRHIGNRPAATAVVKQHQRICPLRQAMRNHARTGSPIRLERRHNGLALHKNHQQKTPGKAGIRKNQ